MKSPQSFLFSEQNKSDLLACLWWRDTPPLWSSLRPYSGLIPTCPFCAAGPWSGCIVQDRPYKCRARMDNYPSLLATPFLMQLRIYLAFWAAQTHHWFVSSFSFFFLLCLCKAALNPSITQFILMFEVLKLPELNSCYVILSGDSFAFSVFKLKPSPKSGKNGQKWQICLFCPILLKRVKEGQE